MQLRICPPLGPDLLLTIIALDDWLIFAKDEQGNVWFVSSEVWPEWLDFAPAPEEMEDGVFKHNSLNLLRHNPVRSWKQFRTWFCESERSFAANRGVFITDAEVEAEFARAVKDLETQAASQADLIKAFEAGAKP